MRRIQISESYSAASLHSEPAADDGPQSGYSLQTLSNSLLENYDNKLIKRQFCEDTLWTLYLISC